MEDKLLANPSANLIPDNCGNPFRSLGLFCPLTSPHLYTRQEIIRSPSERWLNCESESVQTLIRAVSDQTPSIHIWMFLLLLRLVHVSCQTHTHTLINSPACMQHRNIHGKCLLVSISYGNFDFITKDISIFWG